MKKDPRGMTTDQLANLLLTRFPKGTPVRFPVETTYQSPVAVTSGEDQDYAGPCGSPDLALAAPTFQVAVIV